MYFAAFAGFSLRAVSSYLFRFFTLDRFEIYLFVHFPFVNLIKIITIAVLFLVV